MYILQDKKIDDFQSDIYLNGKNILTVYKEVDGYYVADFTGHTGYFSADMLLSIGKLINQMNAEWDAIVIADLEPAET